MGVIKRGLLGGFSGKVANIVGSSWKGIAVMKSLPLSVANPRTAAQVAQRTAFSFINFVGKALLVSIIKPNWDRFAQKMSGINEFVSSNIAYVNETGFVTPSSIKMSKGTLTPAVISAAAINHLTGLAEISWTDNSGEGNAQAGDLMSFVVTNSSGALIAGFNNVATRAAESGEVTVPFVVVTGQEYNFWLIARSADGTKVADSQWIAENAV
jgi:hypothetical protein